MTFKGAIRWSLRPKRVAVMVAKLLLAGTTDLTAQTTTWQEVNSGVLHISIHLEGQGHEQGQAGERADPTVNREFAVDGLVEGCNPGPQARLAGPAIRRSPKLSSRPEDARHGSGHEATGTDRKGDRACR
jgi:hypothetical protein